MKLESYIGQADEQCRDAEQAMKLFEKQINAVIESHKHLIGVGNEAIIIERILEELEETIK